MRCIAFVVAVVWTACGCTSGQPTVHPVEAPPTSAATPSDLRSNFSEQEFAAALVGRWTSVFTYPSATNVDEIEFSADNHVRGHLVGTNARQDLAGVYRLEFERPPDPGMVTIARIVIRTDSGERVLRPVTFGLHNGVLQDEGLLLRIDHDLHGVLKRVRRSP